VKDNHEVGLYAAGSDVVIEATVVRGTRPQLADQVFGHGIAIQLPCTLEGCDAALPAHATVRGSIVEDNYEGGLFVAGSDALVEGCVVRRILPRAADGSFGDGITAVSAGAAARVQIASSRIDESARAGLSSFGAFAALRNVAITCAAFALDGELLNAAAFTFDDGGGNACTSCLGQEGTCSAVSAGLAPPEPLAPIE
jgi:hypothetical protein